jgi:hypothetical protein
MYLLTRLLRRLAAATSTFPNPNGRAMPLARDFQAAMKAAFPQIEVTSA